MRLEAKGALTRDPSVALCVVAQLPYGSPAEGLGITWPDAAGLYYMSDGKNEAGLEDGLVVGGGGHSARSRRQGAGDVRREAGGPNSYRFTHHPSDVEPFDFQARALDAKAELLEVELGSASATLQRVRD